MHSFASTIHCQTEMFANLMSEKRRSRIFQIILGVSINLINLLKLKMRKYRQKYINIDMLICICRHIFVCLSLLSFSLFFYFEHKNF